MGMLPASRPVMRSQTMLDSFLTLRREAIERGGVAGSGGDLCLRLTAALDEDVAGLLPGGGRLALVAVGGYGRRELCLYSDIDLMLLHSGSVPSGAERVFYPLWDAGLKVGHAVRSSREAIQAAREHIETLTALLDARLIAGDADLYGELCHGLSTLMRRGRVDLGARLEMLERERRQREPYLLQELNVKEGRGGLRALHGLHWEARARELSGRGAGGVGPAHETLLVTRNALHAVSGKAFDSYVYDLHQPVAEWLGVDSQAWSRQLYQAVRGIDRAVTRHWAAAEVRPARDARRWTVSGLLGRRSPSPAPPAQPSEPRAFYGGSVLSLAARAAAGSGPPFDLDQESMIRAAMGPMWTAEDREGFLTLLRTGDRGAEIFDALDALGWAERALPEWSHVCGLPQYPPFHLHPVDVHLWRTVSETLTIARRDSPEPVLAGVAAELDSLDDALLAALLHDIGKGWPGDHSIAGARAARAFCRRARFGPRTAATVSRAIEHHLLLPTVATRRDLDDPAVIRDVADAIGDARTLRVLYLLSVADSRATGPAVWSPWKGSLMRMLYERTDDELRRRERAVQPARPEFDLAPIVALVRDVAGESVVRQHFAAMPAGYAGSWQIEEMAQHIRLMWPAPGPGEIRLEVTHGGAADDLVLALEDRPGLLSITSGVLALHNISVLGGRFATRSDGVALQALHVVDALGVGIDDERWSRVRRDIPRVLRGEIDLEALLREKLHAGRLYAGRRLRVPTRVVVDAQISSRATLVEVHAEDRTGLLHDITRALFELRLDINLAKVDTLGREVVDVFYVRDLAGHPPREGAELARIEQVVLAALER
jgi:[protein-PII] uridylyltransferase